MNDAVYRTRGLARLGIVVPVSNTNLEPDMMMLVPAGISLHFVRAGGYDVDRIPDETQMRSYSNSQTDELIEDLRACRSDIVLYGCTSATLAQGPVYDREFRARIESIAGVPAVTAAQALVEALQVNGIERYAFTSPYVRTLNDLAIEFIGNFGIECVSRLDAPCPMSNDAVAAARPEEIIALAEEVDSESAQAIVISCTDYRATEAIEAIEQRLGKPVITSNQATLLVALQRLGLPMQETTLNQQLAAAGFQPRCNNRSESS